MRLISHAPDRFAHLNGDGVLIFHYFILALNILIVIAIISTEWKQCLLEIPSRILRKRDIPQMLVHGAARGDVFVELVRTLLIPLVSRACNRGAPGIAVYPGGVAVDVLNLSEFPVIVLLNYE